MMYSKEFAKVLYEALEERVTMDHLEPFIEKPKHLERGDLAFPCFSLAKTERKSPQLIAQEVSQKINSPLFEKVEAAGGYLNVFLNKQEVTAQVLEEILQKKQNFGASNSGKRRTVAIDMSSPNIAKPFSMGHLRSTVIGQSLALLLAQCGYKPVKINHLGDWGTQFGKLITAYKHWGNEEKVKANPIKELLALYVKFHEEAEKNVRLEAEGREWFKRLEDGDEEAAKLWKWFRAESLKDFSRIYKLLNIDFDSYAGEAFYNDKMDHVVDLLESRGLLTESEQAQVVSLEEEDLPPCLIKKSDGATLYATRDLAAALYRKETYNFEKALYVVGGEQSLHFKQLKAVLKKLGFDWADDLVHVSFGMMRKDGKKMSTRKGQVVLLEEVLQESIALAKENIELKNPNLPNKEEVARQVGVGAIVFNDLKNYRMNDIDFSLEDILRFEGETGPYVQYTHARACSILRKAAWDGEKEMPIQLSGEQEWEVIGLLMAFPETIKKAAAAFDPSRVAKHIIDLAQAFNKYYAEVKVLQEDEQKESRLAFVSAVTQVLRKGLSLLGIEAPDEM
ncbi:arginine--tRNA ligase [Pseudobacillus wudalianchiensis]|uniref:Arginine--tRNA ligase n=1 Tax=Pseudobacillus wudalianchiensis TaxID=1743143 RepID=A0A1B9AYT0_9BACI|nr:arginine--tRNA ligase [Bacillus wudalianchiensis]OCA89115.1 arginine--tRNA ligase [Bacillus wudalianchiensis]